MKKLFLLLLPALLVSAPTAAVAEAIAGREPLAIEVAAAADAPLGVMQNALELLRAADRFTATAAGKTTAKKGFLSYEQKITNTVVGRGGEFYVRSESKSKFLNMKHEVYARGGRVAYRDDGGAIATATSSDYASAYGVVPGESIDGHIVGRDSVVEARLVGAADGRLTYAYEIDPARGCAGVRKQMQAFGGLKTPPEYRENVLLTLTVREEDFAPVSLETTDKYSIRFGVIGNVDCTQTMSYTFVYGDAPIPDEALFAAALA